MKVEIKCTQCGYIFEQVEEIPPEVCSKIPNANVRLELSPCPVCVKRSMPMIIFESVMG